MQLPNPPWYRRWSVILAGIIVLAAFTAFLGWRGLQQATRPATATPTVPTTTVPEPSTTTPSSTGRPAPTTTRGTPGVLWEKKGSETHKGQLFRAPTRWRIVWSFDCSNFAKFDGGNFKLSGQGAFEQVLIQEFDVKANGTRSVRGGGFGSLEITSVCRAWTVRALPA